MPTARTAPTLPGSLWHALWDGRNTATGDWPWGAGQYTGHSRGHPYRVNSEETRGGHAITVDRDARDGPAAATV
ncbi:hypothetical protein [Streptomyces sp. NPDC018947]|uniref:hypothetical protein n=1 Tax=Streptomyces sp. NPDC018947 TaxID=3365054 RepID=UPI003796B809